MISTSCSASPIWWPKRTNPDAVIHLAAFTYWADVNAGREQYMARLLDRILQDPQAASHNYYFDVATAHLYFQADQIYELLRFFRGLLVERGLDQPYLAGGNQRAALQRSGLARAEVTLAVTESEQAAFMPQALAAALAAGAERSRCLTSCAIRKTIAWPTLSPLACCAATAAAALPITT